MIYLVQALDKYFSTNNNVYFFFFWKKEEALGKLNFMSPTPLWFLLPDQQNFSFNLFSDRLFQVSKFCFECFWKLVGQLRKSALKCLNNPNFNFIEHRNCFLLIRTQAVSLLIFWPPQGSYVCDISIVSIYLFIFLFWNIS